MLMKFAHDFIKPIIWNIFLIYLDKGIHYNCL